MKEDLLVKFGEVIGAVDGMSDNVKTLATQQELTRHSVEKQGLFLGELFGDVQSNKKRISSMNKRLGFEEEVTSRIKIEREVRKDYHNFWKWAIGAAVAVAGTAGTIIAALAAAGV